jgi:hypothetical protein
MADEHLERLLAELGERAKLEIAQATAAGQAEAERVRAVAELNARERIADALRICEREEAQRRAGEVAVARRRGRRALLEAQHAFVNRVLARAAELIAERLRTAGPEAMQARVDSLLSYAADHDADVRADATGITVLADGGHLRIDDSVNAWLEQNHAELAIAVCRVIEMPASSISRDITLDCRGR